MAQDPSLAATPEPPYWVVIFTSRRTAEDEEGYEKMGEAMAELATKQPGYLGIESVRGEDGVGITLSYWASEQAIHDWKRVAAHLEAQRRGHATWYRDFVVRVAKVERAYTLATSPKAAFTAGS